jgi:predicted TIM-barrel fold metal-dependent hydrolase
MIVDADLHNTVSSVEALVPYLSPFWQEQVAQTGFKGPFYTVYPLGLPTSARDDVRAAGAAPGTSLEVLREQALDGPGVDIGILNCAYSIDSIRNPDAAAALAAAVNDWQREEWLEQEPRLRASIVVPSQFPELAAAEIARAGEHPGFVQVFLPTRSAMPYGRREYAPLFEAAVERDLVVSVQYGGFSGNAPTPVGWPTYGIEEYVGMATVAQSQLISIVAEGVFDRFPTLRLAMVDSGFTWLPAFLWRLDKDWKGIRREVPWVRRPPSEYVLEHVRFTIAPVDAPADPELGLSLVLDQLPAEELLLFASDYPHWRWDARERALLDALPDRARARVMGANASEFYRLH